MRILAIGECMAELAPSGAPATYGLGFAGDTFNTAWYLAKLGREAPVSYLTAVGDDAISDGMRRFMADSGINTDHVLTVQDRTVGLYLITLDKGERSFSYWRGQSAAKLLARDPDAMAAAMAEADLVFFSGITLAVLEEADRETLLSSLRTARAAGKTIAFDPNLRPRLWADTDDMLATIMAGAAVSDLALPSFEDEAEWFGDSDPDATADRYANAGATTVIVKNGAGDIHAFHDGARTVHGVQAISDIVDTTAAGDSFNAGVLAGIRAGAPLEVCISLGARLAGIVVQGKGALVSFDPADVQAG